MKRFKQLFYLFIFLCSCNSSKSQIYSSLGAGYSFKGNTIGNLDIGYEKSIIAIQGEIRPSLTRKSEMDNLLGFRLSGNLIDYTIDGLRIQPGVGYYYNFKSADKKVLNHWQYGYALKSSIEVTQDGSLYIESFYSKVFQLTIGMQVTLHKRNHY